jgi:hypothetical protein
VTKTNKAKKAVTATKFGKNAGAVEVTELSLQLPVEETILIDAVNVAGKV